MTSTRAEIEAAIQEAISEDTKLRAVIEGIPDKVADTVQQLTPVDKGTAKASIEAKARRTPWRRLSTRRTKVGEVFSDDDPAKINTLEHGRSASDDNGSTPAFHMFAKAAAAWELADVDVSVDTPFVSRPHMTSDGTLMGDL